MKLMHQFAVCGTARPLSVSRRIATAGAVMLAIVWNGWAAEPQKAPRSDHPSVPAMFTPVAGGPVNTGGPVHTGGPANTGGPNAAGQPGPFSAEIGADFMKKVMETSAKIEEARRQIAERQAQLYATNPEIKSTRALMVEGQKEINRILDADQELVELKMSRDILWSIMPAMPKGQNPASMPRMPVAR